MTDQTVYRAVDHVLAVLREELPPDLAGITHVGLHVPSLLNQLPFISVSAEAVDAHPSRREGTVGLKRERIDGALIDLGYVTADAGECLFTLSLWSVTRLQVGLLRAGVAEVPWVRREHSWENPPGTLNRTTLLRCRLNKQFVAQPAHLPSPPPHITVQTGSVDLRAGPSGSADRLGQAENGQQFEILGRSGDGDWVQGCCLEGQAVWMETRHVETTVPVAVIPVTEGVSIDPALLQPGAAVLVPESAAAPAVWRLDLQYAGYLEATQEPIEDKGGRIAELRITRELGAGDQPLDTERTRLFADGEEIVDTFPD